MYEPTRKIMSFTIAGFSHWYGAGHISELKPGDKLDLVSEPDNPYDSCAVAIYLGEDKLGYVPAAMNGEISQLMYFGYADIFECIVTQVDPEAHPEAQVRVSIFVKDNR